MLQPVTPNPLPDHLDLLATAPDGIKRLRGLILELAVRGKLVPQNPADEPASELLKRIEAEKARLVKEGKIRKPKAVEPVGEDERPFEAPEGWLFVRFDELATDVSTGPFGSMLHQSDYVGGGIPLVNPSHMIGGKIVADSNIAVAAGKAEELGAYRLEAGDIVMARRGEVGRAAIVATSQSGWLCGTGSFVIRLLHELSRDFLLLLFRTNSVRSYLGAAAVGTTMVNLNHGILKRMPVPLPPLPEQHRIVARVDELMALCDRLEAEQADAAEAHARLVDALLATLTASRDAAECAANWQRLSEHFDTLFTTEASITALKQTVLQLAVMGRLVPQDPSDEPAGELLKRMEAEKARLVKEGKIRKPKAVEPVGEDERPFDAPSAWQWTQLCQLATEGPRNGYSPKPAAYETPYRCLTLSATTSGSFREECYKFVDIPLHIAEQHYLKNGDLLIQRGNSIEYVGIAALYEGDDDGFLYPDLMIRLRLSQQISRRYVHLVLVSNYGRSYFTSRASGTQGSMPKVNHGVVSATPIPLPPLPEQHRIVAKVDELMALCDRLQADLVTAREHRARLADTLVQASLEAA